MQNLVCVALGKLSIQFRARLVVRITLITCLQLVSPAIAASVQAQRDLVGIETAFSARRSHAQKRIEVVAIIGSKAEFLAGCSAHWVDRPAQRWARL